MTPAFVAVLGTRAGGPPTTAERDILLAAGASAVLNWTELLTGPEPDDAVAVLLELTGADGAEPTLIADLKAALGAFAAVDDALPPGNGQTGGAVVVTTRPVTDTLKFVDVAGFLTGTAEREEHRFVRTPIAARLRWFRAVAADPAARLDPVAVLTALAARGVTVIGTSG
jgi:hypothetical protein